MMKYYRDTTGNVFAFEADGSQDGFIPPHLTKITEAAADKLRQASAPPPPAAHTPMVVSRFQARAALHLAGLLPQVEAAVAAADPLVQIAWSDAVEFRRDSPTIAALAAAIKMTDAQIDDLFRTAAGIAA